jgi:hypothetical protein
LCPAPNPASITNITPTGANINWTGPVDAEYEYLISTSPITAGTAPGTGTSTIFTSLAQGNLNQGTQYFVYVRTKCSSGIYSSWVSSSFTTTYPPCNTPGFLTATTNNATANISWTQVTGSLVGYEYAITTNSTEPTSGKFTSSLSYDTTNLNSNTRYYVYVRTVCGPSRFSQWVKISFVTVCFKPSPFLIRNSPIPGTADFGWKKVNGVIRYEYAILPYASTPSGSMNFTIDTTLQAIHLIQGSKYYLHVRSHCNASGVSEWSTLEFHTSGLGVYPNPITSSIRITRYGLEVQNEEIVIFDAAGHLLIKTRLIGSSIELSLKQFAAGVYLIRYGKNKTHTLRIVKL